MRTCQSPLLFSIRLNSIFLRALVKVQDKCIEGMAIRCAGLLVFADVSANKKAFIGPNGLPGLIQMLSSSGMRSGVIDVFLTKHKCHLRTVAYSCNEGRLGKQYVLYVGG